MMDHGNRLPLDVSPLISELIGSCETICDAGCCGPNAFDFSEEHVASWIELAGMERAIEARLQLQELIARTKEMEGELFCDRVNVYWTPPEAVSFFEMYAGFLELAGVPEPPREPGVKVKLPPFSSH